MTACEPSSPPEPEKGPLNLTESRFAAVSEDLYKIGLVVFSPDGMKAAYAAQKGQRQFVVVVSREEARIKTKKGRPYEGVSDIVFSPDGQRIAYIARRKGKSFIVLDGLEGRPYDDAANPVFSPDNRHVAYEAKRDGKWFMVADANESLGADMHYMPPVFSPDSKLITYIEQHYAEKKTFRVVSDISMKDRKVGREYDHIGAVAFSPDGSRVAYVASRDGKVFVVTGSFSGEDETESPAYDESPGFIAFSPDGRRVAYYARKNQKNYLVIDGKESLLKYPMVLPPVFSPDGSRIALVLLNKEKGMQFVKVGNREYPLYDRITNITFSHDGLKVVYVAREWNQAYIVVNDKKGPVYDMVVSPVFSPDGSKMAYRARKNEKRFIVIADRDGNTIKELPSYDLVWQPVFSPDGRFIAYGAAIQAGQEIWWKVERLGE